MRKIYLLTLLSIFSVNLYCQVYWTKHPDNPVMLPGATGQWDENLNYIGSVIYHEGQYHMWYSGWITSDDNSIGYATSPDGIMWTKDPNNPVLEKGSAGSWDQDYVSCGDVTMLNDTLHMWYNGHKDGWENSAIGHATSVDGVNWTRDTNNPVLIKGQEGSWEYDWLWIDEIIYDGSQWHMWYETGNLPGSGTGIGHATSPDGVVWTKDPSNPVFNAGTSDDWDYPNAAFPTVVFDSTTFHMWYCGGDMSAGHIYDIGYATSQDGSTWTKYPWNPVIKKGSSGAWDDHSLLIPSVMDSAGIKYKMWYRGDNKSHRFGYAESDTRDPYLLVVESKPVYDSTDTIIAQIILDGTIYVVPEGTNPVVDSILKYMITSVEAMAETIIKIPLTDLIYGQYIVIAVSNEGFVSTNPFLIEVVADATQPIIELAKDTVYQGDTIIATSNKDGIIYLVHKNTPPYMAMITHPANLRDEEKANANTPVSFTTSDLKVDRYRIYAVDIYGINSEPTTVTVQPAVGVKENTNTGIIIYPNPANDLMIIETDQPGQHFIEITSLNGQLLYIDRLEGPTHQIDLSSFEKGLYYIIIRSKDYVRTEKIIKL